MLYVDSALLTWLSVLVVIVLVRALIKRWNRGRRQRAAPQTPFSATLRDVNDSDGSRLLVARLTSDGDVVIEGRDYGEGVVRVLGFREYEWVWTIPATAVPALLQALEATDDVISAISRRFSGDAAADLSEFLETNGIPTERWSRTGD